MREKRGLRSSKMKTKRLQKFKWSQKWSTNIDWLIDWTWQLGKGESKIVQNCVMSLMDDLYWFLKLAYDFVSYLLGKQLNLSLEKSSEKWWNKLLTTDQVKRFSFYYFYLRQSSNILIIVIRAFWIELNWIDISGKKK